MIFPRAHLIAIENHQGDDQPAARVIMQRRTTILVVHQVRPCQLDQQGLDSCWHQWYLEARLGLPGRKIYEIPDDDAQGLPMPERSWWQRLWLGDWIQSLIQR